MRFFPRQQAIPAVLFALTMAASAGTEALGASLTRVSPYLTRAEAVAIILLASPAPLPDPPAKHLYIDVLETDWFAPTMLAAVKTGVISADATGTKLRPFGSVNRAAFLKMLSLSFGLPTNKRFAFTDVPHDTWYAPYVGTEQAYRLFSHADPTKLEPDRLVTQDEARIAMQVFLHMRSNIEEQEAKDTAIAQSSGRVQLYTVISTKKLRVVLLSDSRKKLTSFAESAPQKEHPSYTQTLWATPTITRAKTAEDIRAKVLELVNAERLKVGLPALNRSAALEQSAQTFADAMHIDGFFGHTDPDGKTLKDRIDAVQYYSQSFSADCQCMKGYALGENIARGQRSAEEVVQAWMESPSHRDAILGSDFTDLGVGVQSGVWVQHFGGVLLPGAQ